VEAVRDEHNAFHLNARILKLCPVTYARTSLTQQTRMNHSQVGLLKGTEGSIDGLHCDWGVPLELLKPLPIKDFFIEKTKKWLI